MSKTIKVAAIQMVSTPDVAHNLARARHWLQAAAAQGAQLAALPEYFCLMGLQDSDKLGIAETFQDAVAPIQAMLSQTAAELGLWLIGGTLPVHAATPARVRNASCVYAPDGKLAARYDKIHLFRFDNGSESYDEGRVLEAGEQPTSFVADIGGQALKVGLSVCYDLRFPELYRAMSFADPTQPPCDLFAVPAAFTYITGQAHWELLLRARAVENQAFVIAPAQGGTHQNGRRTWGHSMVIDPWGEVLACLPEGEGLAMATLDLERLRSVRQQLPALDAPAPVDIKLAVRSDAAMQFKTWLGAFLLALLSPLLMLSGCGTPAKAPGMRITPADVLQMRSWIPPGLKGQMVLAPVTGGEPTGRFWGSRISNSMLEQSIDESLRALGLLTNVPGGGRYTLTAKLIELDQPMVALTMKVSVTIEYSLIDRQVEDKLVYQHRLRTVHTVNFTESMLDINDRTRLASEGAVRRNVEAMVRELMEIGWN